MSRFDLELAEYAAGELGLIVGADCFAGFFPDVDLSGPACAFLQVGGPEPPFEGCWKTLLVQVRTKSRTNQFEEGYELANDIYDLLHSQGDLYLPSWHCHWIAAQAEPYPLGRDEKNREDFSFTILARIRET